MRKRLSSFGVTLLLLSLVLVTVGCGVAQATFTASVDSGTALLKVEFTNGTKTGMFSKVDKYNWDFGDGDSATTTKAEETVTHEYTKAGTYTVTLTAMKGDKDPKTSVMTLSISVTHGPLDHVQITPATVQLDIGDSQKFTTAVEDAYGNPIAEASLTWNAAAGTISADGSFEAGTRAGTFNSDVEVNAGYNNKTVSGVATVTINPDPLDAVTISPISLPAGETQRIEAVAVDKYGNVLDNVEISWNVADAEAGSIVSGTSLKAGEITGEYENAVEVEVTQGNITRTAATGVIVTAGALDEIYIAPDPADIGIGMTQQFVAVGADRYGNRISGLDVDWSVINGGGAIDSSGLFTAGTLPGMYTDTIKAEAALSGVTRSAKVDVTVEPDRIAYMSDAGNDDGVFDIYIMDISGNNQKRITTSHVDSSYPGVSPGGSLIAYADESGGINVINDDGKWAFPLTSGQEAYEPAWSPDGTKIAYTVFENVLGGYDQPDIYVMDVDGSNVTKLTDHIDWDISPSWSPDGTMIAFESYRDGNWEIYVENINGTGLRRITNNNVFDANARWSPDGQKIIYQSIVNNQWELFTVNIDGTQVTQVTYVNYSCCYPYWSPDGSKIVFHSWQDDNQSEISIANADGSNITQLTHNQALDYAPVYMPRKAGVAVSELSISIPLTADYQPMTAQKITALVGDAVVRIETNLGSGSGFLISPNGLLLTSNHVVSNAQTISVYLQDGTKYNGTVIGRDLMRDLALLKISASGLAYLEISDFSGASLGQQVVVLGYPLFSTKLTVTSGIVSSMDFDGGRNITWVQTDSAVNPGNSGGPMLDMRGRVVGIVTAKMYGIGIEGIGFTISVNTINTYIPRLQAGETILY
ncbi:MAG: trypsin-like peptidase domain-containing protein [Dehalococcoidales bacterium]|jgi:dipeptidyl aminopeptidase/acylaminoacyl peptidase